ncbi:MAG: prolyl oligopeptidase family serine peptidase [Terriglobia bacterium]
MTFASIPELEGCSLDSVLDSLFAAHQFRQVAISPDGQHVAWVESLNEPKDARSRNAAIFLASLLSSSAAALRITAASDGGAHEENEIAWSPDGGSLAFLSDAQTPGQLQAYVASVPGGELRRLTTLTGSLAAPEWSPDGRTLALLFVENAPSPPGPMEPLPLPSGVIGSKVLEQRLATVDVATGNTRQVSPADLYVYEYQWSPDGTRFVATAAHGGGNANWYVARFYVIDAASGETKSLHQPDQQIAVPRWSRDAKYIAFIGGLMSDEPLIGGDIFLLPTSGGEARNITPGLSASASWLAWRGDDEILFAATIDGECGISTVRVSSGQITWLWKGPETLSARGGSGTRNPSVSLSKNSEASAIILESGSRPQELWAGPIADWKQITHENDGEHPLWGKDESIHWICDGLTIQGWLTYPADYDSSRRYPLVVQIHGGPSGVARPRWPLTSFDFTILSQQGYFVLRPNPRGSFGQGEKFTRANVRDFGYGDLRDILAGVDHVVKHFPVDNDRVGIGGWSYGGFMAMWAVTQTNRFRAAVAGAGIANWQSYYGENDIGQWMIPFFGASVYDDPAIYAKSSPINFIKQVKTPTLILVGDRDGECPLAQSMEFWHALETLGVENRFVVYPNEGHSIASPEHRRDIMRRVGEWYGRYLNPARTRGHGNDGESGR